MGARTTLKYHRCVAVVDIMTGALRYIGRFACAAAHKLKPGCTFGQGKDRHEAISRAQQRAAKHREGRTIHRHAA